MAEFDAATFNKIREANAPPKLTDAVGSTNPSDDSFNKIRAANGLDVVRPKPAPPSGVIPFTESLFSAMTKEQFGIEPNQRVAEYRAGSPWGGGISHAIGYGVPLIAAGEILAPLAGLRAIPLLGRGMAAAEELATAGGGRAVLGGALKEAAGFLPYEAGVRLPGAFIAEASGHEGAVRRTAEEASMDLLAAGIFGAGKTFIRQVRPGASAYERFGPEQRIQRHLPEYDPNALPQQRFDQLTSMKIPPNMPEMTKAGLQSDINAAKEKVSQEILLQLPGAKMEGMVQIPDEHVRDLVVPERTPGAHGKLNEMWTPGATKGLGNTMMLAVADKGVKSTEELVDTLTRWAPPENWQASTQFPRLLRAGKGDAAGIRGVLDDSLVKVDNNLWIGNEADNGLYTIAQRLPTKPGKAAEYMMFKTHDPHTFYKDLATNPVEREAMKLTEARMMLPETHESWSYKHLLNTLKEYPPPEAGTIPAATRPRFKVWAEEHLPGGVESLRQDLVRLSGGIGRNFKAILAPATHQLSASPKAVWLQNVARAQFDHAMTTALKQFYGERAPIASATLWGAMLEKPKYSGGINDLIEKVYASGPQAIEDWNRAALGAIPFETAQAEGFHPVALEALKAQDDLEAAITKQLTVTDKATEVDAQDMLIPLENHRMISRLWKGDFRAAVKSPTGDVVGYGSGNDSSQAYKEAKALAARASELAIKDGKPGGYTFENPFLSSKDMDKSLFGTLARNPDETQRFRQALIKEYGLKRYVERPATGNLGYIGDIKPMSLKEAKDNLLGNIVDSHMHMAMQSYNHGMKSEILKFALEDPALAQQLKVRVMALRGMESDFNRAVSKGVNRVLAPVLGNDGAEKIVRTTNQGLYGLTLGFLDLGYPIVNLTSALTQMMPEVAYNLRAPEASLAKDFTAHLIKGRNGMHTLNVMDGLKFLRGVLVDDMGHPGPELKGAFDRALNERIIAPGFIEAVAGKEVQELQAAWKSGNYPLALWRLSQFPGAKSEEFARGIGFAGAWRVATKYFHLEGDRAYDFAVQQLRKSMYGYATADRPRLLTGILGTGFGLFKNWGFSYISNMMEYAGQGLLHGNWSPFMWQMATGAAVGGVGGTPMLAIANGLSQMYNDKSFMENSYNYFGAREEVEGLIGNTAAEMVADTFYYGIPTWGGISLQNRASLPGTDPLRDISQLSGVLLIDRATRLYDAVHKGFDYYDATGNFPIHDQEFRDSLNMAFAPRSLQRMASMAQDGAIRSMRNGNTLTGPMGYADQFAFFLGITPTEVAKGHAVAEILDKDQEKKKAAISATGQAMSYARRNNDPGETFRVVQRAYLHGVNLNSALRASRVYDRNMQWDHLDRQMNATSMALRKITGTWQE